MRERVCGFGDVFEGKVRSSKVYVCLVQVLDLAFWIPRLIAVAALIRPRSKIPCPSAYVSWHATSRS